MMNPALQRLGVPLLHPFECSSVLLQDTDLQVLAQFQATLAFAVLDHFKQRLHGLFPFRPIGCLTRDSAAIGQFSHPDFSHGELTGALVARRRRRIPRHFATTRQRRGSLWRRRQNLFGSGKVGVCLGEKGVNKEPRT